eukprot:jgi/Tetstr1/436108/TSEL_024956.t1
MGVYTVRGLNNDDEGSLRKVLDKELVQAAPARSQLLRKMRGQNMNTVRDITLWDMMDADDLYGMMVSEYGCSMPRRAFLRRLGLLDRDGTGRIRVAELHNMLTELVLTWASETEEMSVEQARAHLQGVMDRGITPLGRPEPTSPSAKSPKAQKTKLPVSNSFLSRYLPRRRSAEEEEGAEYLDVSSLAPPPPRTGQGKVQVLYSSQPMAPRGGPAAGRLPPRPGTSPATMSAASKPGRSTCWERFQLQGETSKAGRAVGSAQTSRIMSAAYDYGPRVAQPGGGGTAVVRPRSVPNPPVLVQSLAQRRIDVMNAELSRSQQELQMGMPVAAAPGCITSQTYLVPRNHASLRPTTCPAPSQPPRSPAIPGRPPAGRPTTSHHHAAGARPPRDSPWWEGSELFADEERQLAVAEAEALPRAGRTQTSAERVPPLSRARPMSRYKYRQAEAFLTRDYTPSSGEKRLGWAPPRAGSRAKGTRSMLAAIKLKERPTASALSTRLDAFHQVRQAEARGRGVAAELTIPVG